jgi:hypothetical protein
LGSTAFLFFGGEDGEEEAAVELTGSVDGSKSWGAVLLRDEVLVAGVSVDSFFFFFFFFSKK